MNPKFEFKNVISVIKIAGFIILFPYNDNVIPAEKASILVAIPINRRQVSPMQRGLFELLSKASLINFIPKNRKMVKTIKLVNGAINDLTKEVK